jgi:hypothetical protein
VNIYVDLTKRFNLGRLRAVLAGGQAVVLHRLAVMSKDGDWILREDEETMAHILDALESYGARYRFGAPLDLRWLAGGWSAHLEFRHETLRVRTDFVTRPARLDEQALKRLWTLQEGRDIPRAAPRDLVEMKKTNREKDYAVIGELARIMTDPDDRLLCSRSARDLMALAREHPGRADALATQRPVLRAVGQGPEALETALDAERRQLIHANERRLARYMTAAERWAQAWPAVAAQIDGKPLSTAHRILCRHAESLLPFGLKEEPL